MNIEKSLEMTTIHCEKSLPFGKLTMFIGPMAGGKTYELLRCFRVKQQANLRVCLVKPSITEDDLVSSRNQTFADATIMVSESKELLDYITNYDHFFIDEGHFLPDLGPIVETLNRQGKDVTIASLDTDFNAVPYEHIMKLVRCARKIHKYRAVCNHCYKRNALFSYRISGNVNPIEVDKHSYISLCTRCFMNANPTFHY